MEKKSIMRCKSKNVLIVILIMLILAVNIFTIFILLKKPKTTFAVNLLGNPTSIAVNSNGFEKTVTSEMKSYTEILKFSEQSYQLVDYFELIENIDFENDSVWLEYRYDSPYKLMLKLSHEIRAVETKRVTIILTGEYSGTVIIDTEDGKITVGTLNIGADFIYYAKEFMV